MTEAFGEACIEESLFNYIRDILPEGQTILELGSGWGTTQFMKHYNVVSIEHDIEYVAMATNRCFHAPLVPHKAIRNHDGENTWYDRDVVKDVIYRVSYDLLLVDGPPGGTRCGIVKYIDLFDPEVPMIFDDLQRRAEMAIINSIGAKLKKPYVVYTHLDGKPFGVINDPRLRSDK